MKNIIYKISVLSALLLGSSTLFAQDVQINIAMTPASVAMGESGTILVQICNNDFLLTCPANKLRPLISIPSGISVIPTTPTTAAGIGSNPDNWSLMTNDGSSIRLTNTQTILPGDCSTYYINITGTAVGGPSTITGTIAFNGPQTTDNLVGNDNSTTSITVTTPLPVTLVNFAAKEQGCSALMSWETAEEKSFSHFEVERMDGNKFTRIGTVKATGSNSKYSFTDRTAPEGKNQYRLAIVDNDGSTAYSKIAHATIACNSQAISIYPNPAKEKVYIKGLTGTETVQVYNAIGQLIVQHTATGTEDMVDLGPNAAGIYQVVIIRGGASVFNTKVIKE